MNIGIKAAALIGMVVMTHAYAQSASEQKQLALPLAGQPITINSLSDSSLPSGKTWQELLNLPAVKPRITSSPGTSTAKPLRVQYNQKVVDPDLYDDIVLKNFPVNPPGFSLPSVSETSAKAENAACNDARKTFDQQSGAMASEFGKNFEDPDLARFIPAARLKAFYGAAAAFDQVCLASADSIPESLKNAGIHALVGIIRNGNAAYCTGFRIRQNVIATARHCLFDRAVNAMYRGLDVNNLSFSFAGDGWQVHRVMRVVNGQKPNPPGAPGLPFGSDQDYLFLVTESIQATMPTLTFSREPMGRDELFVYGFFRNFDAAERAGQAPVNAMADRGLRWTKAGSCIVGATHGPCIYHGCQTLEGFSGAPMIRRGSSGAIELLGIHVTGVGSDRVCPAELVGSLGNVGIKLPEDLVNLVSSGEK